MIDWALAFKVSFGGFALVFLILILLGVAITATRLVVERIEKDSGRK
jgi:hypothetical protein